MVQTNCYILQNEDTKEVIIVDPAENAEAISRRIEAMKGKPVAILLTHGHFDHIMASKELKEMYKIPIYAHGAEEKLLADPALNLSQMSGTPYTVKADVLLKDGDEPDIPGFKVRVLHTPGHTEGSCCYYFYEDKVLMSGDTLFKGSCGRTDFPTSSWTKMEASLKRLVTELPGETAVYPGHEDTTTIAFEKRFNSFV
jgi:hydroxyacylglutathione hydrolase